MLKPTRKKMRSNNASHESQKRRRLAHFPGSSDMQTQSDTTLDYSFNILELTADAICEPKLEIAPDYVNICCSNIKAELFDNNKNQKDPLTRYIEEEFGG